MSIFVTALVCLMRLQHEQQHDSQTVIGAQFELI